MNHKNLSASPSRKLQCSNQIYETQEYQKQGIGIVVCTVMQPNNIYKKILHQCHDKDLTKANCNITQGFHVIKQNKIFDCHAISTVLHKHQEFKDQLVKSREQAQRLYLDLKFLETYKDHVIAKDQAAQEKKERDQVHAKSGKKAEAHSQLMEMLHRNNQHTAKTTSGYLSQFEQKAHRLLSFYVRRLSTRRTRSSSGNTEEEFLENDEMEHLYEKLSSHAALKIEQIITVTENIK